MIVYGILNAVSSANSRGNSMSLINSEIKPFKATAYHNGKFVTVTNEDLKGKWSVFVFYPADFTFVCATEFEAPIRTIDDLVRELKGGRYRPVDFRARRAVAG